MAILRDKFIDTTDIKESDKVIRNITGSTMSIQVDGGATISLRGSHANFESDEEYALALVNMTTLATSATASAPGIYLAIIEGIDEITLDLGGSGKIHWKELGD